MDINDNQQINTFIKGMNTDTSDSLLDSSQYRYAENVRPSTDTDSNSGELRLIEGNKLMLDLKEEIIYLTSIRDYIIAVTRSNNLWSLRVKNDNHKGFTTIFGKCSEAIWNEGQQPALCGVTRYESYNNIKLYLTDDTGLHNIMLFNIDEEHWPTTPYTEIKMISGYVQSKLPAPSIQLSTAYGTLKPARVQYVYRLYRYGGASTQLSLLSNIISLYKSDEQGYRYGENASRAVDITIDTANDLALNRILVYRITYEQIGQDPSCALIKDTDIESNSTRTVLTDTGTDISTLSITELLALDTLSIMPKIIESKEDYMFVGSVRYEVDDVDKQFEKIDMRAFSSGMRWEDGVALLFTGRNVPVERKGLQIIHDQFDVSGDSDYNEEFWHFPYGSTGSTTMIGGAGPHVEWFLKEDWVDCSPGSTISKAVQTRRFKHDETYRFGAILYNNKGRKSSVKWIADIRIPSFTKDDLKIRIKYGSGTNKPVGVEYSMRQYYINFSFYNLPDDVAGILIVRCKRGINDTRIVSLGIVGKPLLYWEYDTEHKGYGGWKKTNLTCPSGIYTLLDSATRQDAAGDGSNDPDDYGLAQSVNNIILFASPEYVYAAEDIKNVIAQFKDSIYLKHAAIYETFNRKQKHDDGGKNATYKDGSGGVTTARLWSWIYPDYGFNWGISTKIEKYKGNMTDGDVFTVWPNIYSDGHIFALNEMYSGNRITEFKKNGLTGWITYNHALPAAHSTDTKAVVDYGKKIKKSAYPEVPDWNKFAEGDNIRFQDDITVLDDLQYVNWSWPLALDLRTDKDSPMYGVLTHALSLGTNGETYRCGYPIGTGGKCILFKLEQDTKFGDGNTYYNHTPVTPLSSEETYYGTAFPIHVANLVKPVTPYGGYNERAIKDSVYYQYGYYISNLNRQFTQQGFIYNGEINFKDGDSTAMLFTYNAAHNWYDAQYICCTKMGSVYQVPIETDVDLRGTSGDLLATTAKWGYYAQDLACTFDGYSQLYDAYIYNTAYGAEPLIMPLTTATYTPISNSDFDTRIHHSELKTNGEHIDSWTKFKPANFTDVDSRYGVLTDMRLFKDMLIFWQTGAVGKLRVNERSVVQSMENTQLVLGTGGVLDGFDYMSTVYGMKPSLFADGQSNTALYWWDGNAKEILQLAESIIPLSLQKNVSNYIHEHTENSRPNVVYDNKYKEVMFSVVNDETITYSEFSALFTSIYKFMPSFDTTVYDTLITSNPTKLYTLNEAAVAGQAKLFDKNITPLVQYVVNKNAQFNKVFDISTFGGRFYVGDGKLKHIKFDFKTPLKQHSKGKGTDLITNREYDFRLCIPRNDNSVYGDRMRGKTMQCEISSDSNSTDFSLQYIITKYRMSWS